MPNSPERTTPRHGLSRRQFLRRAGLTTLGLAGINHFASRLSLAATPAPQWGNLSAATAAQHFLRSVGRQYGGAHLHIASVLTPASHLISQIAREEFTPLTGITVDWQARSLPDQLALLRTSAAQPANLPDLFYLDQSWLGEVAHDAVDLNKLRARRDLAFPHWNFADFLPALITHNGQHGGKLVAIPYDIPVTLLIYRQDILDQLGLAVPTTLADYLDTVEIIHHAGLRTPAGARIYGTAGRGATDRYAAPAAFANWLWAHGGSCFDADGRSTSDAAASSAVAQAARATWQQLRQWMPPAARQWDWADEAESFRNGQIGLYLGWSEFFPSFDDPAQSQVVGLASVAPVPAGSALRSPAECAFGETPGLSVQAGGSLAIHRGSAQIEAAWLFLQWATSPEISARVSALTGSTPVRASAFADPRVLAQSKITPGTTRHFGVVRTAIETQMGTLPRGSAWHG